MQSEYRSEPCAGGRVRFLVAPAAGPGPGLVPAGLGGGTLVAAVWGLMRSHGALPWWLVWAGATLLGAAVYLAVSQRIVSALERRRAPGGSFVASPAGLELPTGLGIPRERLQRLSLRNGIPAGRGPGAAVSFLVCAEHSGTCTTLAGGMSQATAASLLDSVRQALALPPAGR